MNMIERTAWHEAGHAVAYLVHRRQFRYVTIRPRTPGQSGRVAVRPRWIDSWTRAVIACAGPTAEGLQSFGVAPPGDDYRLQDYLAGAFLLGGSADVEVMRLACPSADALALVEKMTLDLLRREWSAVGAVASALVVNGTLSYREVLSVLSSAAADSMHLVPIEVTA